MPFLQKCLVLGVFGVLGLVSIAIIISHFTIIANFADPPRRGGAPYPRDTNENLMHFAQVSDIHISTHHEPARSTEFTLLCQMMDDLIKPELLLITGDLTDAKSHNKLYSQQYKEEWETFIDSINQLKRTRLVAIRGNHDAFNEPDQANSQYMHYMRDNLTATTQLFTITKPFGNYSIISVDGAPVPGFKRPFNFVGYVQDESLDKLREIKEQSDGTNQTVLFGHYPTSSKFFDTQKDSTIRELLLSIQGNLHFS